MADNILSTWAPFLFELQGKVQEVFPTEAPFLAELSGVGDPNTVGRFTRDMDGGRDIFSGSNVRHTVVPINLQGGGYIAETQTWNRPIVLSSNKVIINLVRALVPFSMSVDVERDSYDNSNAAIVVSMVREARISLARMENLALVGDGTGVVATVPNATGSPGLVVTVSAGTNFDVLLPGTVWDIVTVSTGVPTTGGKRRKIASVQEAALTVTFDTAQQASDGDSGAITFAATSGIAIPGSASTPALAGTLTAQGLEQAAAITGTFESIDKAAVPQWQGTDGRGGDTSTLALSQPMLDGAVRRGRRAAIGTWDFALGDPAAIDLYKQGLYAQVRYDPQQLMMKSGFSGIAYDGADKPFPLVKEPAHKKGALKLIDKKSFQLYGDQKGPAFLEDDGSMFRRFNPTLIKEADLLDRFQLGVVKCNTIVFLNNLSSAA